MATSNCTTLIPTTSVLLFLLFLLAQHQFPFGGLANCLEPNYFVSTIVGGGNEIGDGLQGVQAILNNPTCVAMHPISGEIYFTDMDHHRIRKIDSNGISISTIAGSGQAGYLDGFANSARFNSPLSLAINNLGEVYVSDYNNHCIRKIGLNGNVTTFAGQCGQSSTNLSYPKGIAIGLQNDEVFVVDSGNGKVKKFYSNGTVIHVAGKGSSDDTTGLLAIQVALSEPYGVCVKSNGDFYISETGGNKISLVSNGYLTTFAGVGIAGALDGPKLLATFNKPTGISISSSDIIYVSDSNNNAIRSISDSAVSTVANSLNSPKAAFASGNLLYIADSSNHRILKVSLSSVAVSTIAGTTKFGDNILANSTIAKPTGNPYIYQDSLIFSDAYNLIRKVNLTTGIINTIAGGFSFNSTQETILTLVSNSTQATFYNQLVYFLNSSVKLIALSSFTTKATITVAGTGIRSISGFSGDGGLAIHSQLNNPYNIAIGLRNEIYIADYNNKRIRMIENGTITTIAGNGIAFDPSSTGTELLAINSRIGPTTIICDSLGTLYFSDYDSSRIMSIAKNGRISTVAGKAGESTFCDTGVASTSCLYNPTGIAMQNQDIYVADNNNYRVRLVTLNDAISTFSGTGTKGNTGDGGLSTLANLGAVRGVAFSLKSVSTGTFDIYLSDFDYHVVRKVDGQTGIITTVVGSGVNGFGLDGVAKNSSLSNPSGLAVDSFNNLYIADFGNNRVRRLNLTSGNITTIAGTGSQGFSGDGGLAVNAQLNRPIGVTVSATGDIYISEYNNHRIRKVSNGIISTIAGGGIGDGIPAVSSYINAKSFIHNNKGEILIADSNNHRIRKITTNGNITTIAGLGQAGYGGDYGLATNSLLNNPTSVISNNNDEIFIADFGNNRIRKILTNGTIITIAGTGEIGFSGDGDIATNAKLSGPTSLALLPGGEILIADQNNHVIRKVYTNGTIVTIGGSPGSPGFDDGKFGLFGKFNGPSGISIDQTTGDIYITDSNNNRIRRLKPTCDAQYEYITKYDSCEYVCYGLSNKDGSVCSGGGNCIGPNNCSCFSGYFGAKCENYYCNGTINTNSSVCSGKGSCISPNNCSCLEGYAGSTCEKYTCYGVSHLSSSVCSGRGKCLAYNTCACSFGYNGSMCDSFECHGYSKNSSQVCSGNGICSSYNNCTCSEGYSDMKCDAFSCAGEKYVQSGVNICEHNGTCTGPGNCNCTKEYGGARCEYVKCFSITSNNATVCSGNGNCIGYNNCTCKSNWYGDDCSVTKCYNIPSNDSSVCGGKGRCIDLDNCSCNFGYKGSKCENTLCFEKTDIDPAVCYGHGNCSQPNNCTCRKGYVGNECQYHETFLDLSRAVIYSNHQPLLSFLPDDNEVFSCLDIFNSTEIALFGESDFVKCYWRSNQFLIELGYGHLIDDGAIIKTIYNFSLRIDGSDSVKKIKSTTTTCSITDQLDNISPYQDVILRSYCDNNFHNFKKFTTVWTCDKCSPAIISLLSSYTNKTIIYIPVALINDLDLDQGLKTLSLQMASSNSLSMSVSSSQSIKVTPYAKFLPPTFTWLGENVGTNSFSCVGHNCIVEASLNSLNSSLSYTFSGFFSLLNSDYSSKQMFRLVNVYSNEVVDSEYSSIVQVLGFQLKTYVSLFQSVRFQYTTFDRLELVMTGVNRTYSLPSTSSITIGLQIDDPFISKYTVSDYISYSWSCFRISKDRLITLSGNLCSTSNTGSSLVFDAKSKGEGSYWIGLTITSAKISGTFSYNYTGYIDLVNSGVNSPVISTDFVPAVTPSQSNLLLRVVVVSSSQVSISWTLKKGKLKKMDETLTVDYLNKATTTNNLVGSSIETYLNIPNDDLIQGEFYEFELYATNQNGYSNASLSSRIDLAPRFSCLVDTLRNLNNITAFESLVTISCIKLPLDSISSFTMEIQSTTGRINILSNTMKKNLVTKLPYYSDSGIELVVKMQNYYGSVSEFKKKLQTFLPNSIYQNGNSLISRFNYVNDEFYTLKRAYPVQIDTLNEISCLISLIVQNSTDLGQRILLEFTSGQLSSFNLLMQDMLSLSRKVQDITYKIDEKIIQMVLPTVSKIHNILNVTMSDSTSTLTDIESWLDWIYTGMNSAINYYPSLILDEIMDSYHYNELSSLQNILSFRYATNINKQSKLSKYNFEYLKLTGVNSTLDSNIENIELTDQINSKSISIPTSYGTITIAFPENFVSQIPLSSKTKLYYSSSIVNEKSTGNLLKSKPILEVSLYDASYSSISVQNLANPITIKFEGLYTTNKTNINTSCIYYDATSNTWSTSGIQSKSLITRRTDDLLFFTMECQVSHLTVFSVQELETTSIPPTAASSGAKPSNNDQTVAIVLGTVLPITFIIITIIVVVIILLILILVRMKHKQSNHIANKYNIELQNADFPSNESMFLTPLSSISSNGASSDEFNPLSRYSNLVRIGQGAFGSVFKAFDLKTESTKALKVIKYTSMEELNNFMKEGAQLMNVSHPHILKVNEFFVSKDQLLCIDMDFYELGDLVKLTEVDYHCSEYLVKQILYQMCEALSYVHTSMKLIHRDIKPSNIFVKSLENDKIHIIVADFGLAKSNIGASNNSYAGTPIFMSPELGLGGKYYHNTDIYSLGVTIYQIITKDTFTSISQLYLANDKQEVHSLIKKKLEESDGYSAKLIDLTLSMLSKDNLVRPQAQDLLNDPYFNDMKHKRK